MNDLTRKENDLTRKEKIQLLKKEVDDLKTRVPTSRAIGLSAMEDTINEILSDLLKEEVVELKQVGWLKWIQTNPGMALFFVTLFFGGTVTQMLYITKDFILPLLGVSVGF